AAREDLDDKHAAAAARAWMRRCLRLFAVNRVGRGALALRLRDGEQLTCSRDVLGPLAAGEQAIVADAVEAAGEHMDEEASDELAGGERHHLGPLTALSGRFNVTLK